MSLAKEELDQVSARLEDPELWLAFHRLPNEMIVSRVGRRMFPTVRASVAGLEPDALYDLLLEFRQVGRDRWRFIDQKWRPGEVQTEQGCCY